MITDRGKLHDATNAPRAIWQDITIELKAVGRMNWHDYPICVPFGNPNYDAHLGGSHDMDVATPPNTPITALVDGVITDISAPTWGKQVCLQIEGFAASFMAYLHLAAVHPALRLGDRVKKGVIIGWSGGCTLPSQYSGTSNPTGQNFLNSPEMSSRPQVGIALMYGPVYGQGVGWTVFPPIDEKLNPMPLLQKVSAIVQVDYQASALRTMWDAILPGIPTGTGIYKSWYGKAQQGVFFGPVRFPRNSKRLHLGWEAVHPAIFHGRLVRVGRGRWLLV